jgi:transcriptional regulator with XRE-family HTH domain
MPNVMSVLRAEIRRLARKESKEAVGDLKRQVTVLRRRVAGYKKKIADVERIARAAGKSGASGGGMGRGGSGAAGEGGGKQIRFSPAWVKSHRKKLALSRRLYAKLVGVSAQTIMLWETGKSRPRRGALATWRAIRGKGRRELKAALVETPKRGRKAGAGRKRRVVKRRKVAKRRAVKRRAAPARRRVAKRRAKKK